MNDQAFREQVIENLTVLKVELKGIVSRLDKINGSVQKHEASLNEALLWRTKQEPEIAKIVELEKKTNVDSGTVLKIALITSGTLLAIFKASGPAADVIVGMLSK